MAVAAVAFDGTRVNEAEANTNWGNEPSGGQAPSAEAQLRYQGSNAVNKKITATVSRAGIKYDPASGAVDMTAAARKLWFVKCYIADFGDLNATFGCAIRLGSASTAFYEYNVAGTGANRSVFNTYPAQGGYLIFALDPNIAGWRESTTGSPSLTTVDYFAFLAQFIAGGAKAENLALDAIDIGTGLTMTAGDGADPEGAFQDFVAKDQDVSASRWGIALSKSGAIIAIGLLTIGSATVTEFLDTSAVVIFPDGYHSAGLFGVLCDIQNASTIINIGATIIGQGSATTEDTRPDFVVSGVAGTLDFSGTLLNHRNVTFTSVCDVVNAIIEAELLTQASANISNSTIRTNALSSVACLKDPTFGQSADLHDCEFVQAGAGHAIELSGVDATYEFEGLKFTGYGATGNDDAALDITAVSGTTTINVANGDTPTYKTAGATVVINANVSATVTVKDVGGTAIAGAQVSVRKDSDNSQVLGGSTDGSGQVTGSVAASIGGVSVRVRKATGGSNDFIPVNSPQTIGAGAFDVTITLLADEINVN